MTEPSSEDGAELAERLGRIVMEESVCGLTIEGARVFCDHPKALEKTSECSCRRIGEKCAAVFQSRIALSEAREAACVEALKDMFALLDEGVLVRDTSADHEPGFAMRQLPFVMRLKKAANALTALTRTER